MGILRVGCLRVDDGIRIGYIQGRVYNGRGIQGRVYFGLSILRIGLIKVRVILG